MLDDRITETNIAHITWQHLSRNCHFTGFTDAENVTVKVNITFNKHKYYYWCFSRMSLIPWTTLHESLVLLWFNLWLTNNWNETLRWLSSAIASVDQQLKCDVSLVTVSFSKHMALLFKGRHHDAMWLLFVSKFTHF